MRIFIRIDNGIKEYMVHLNRENHVLYSQKMSLLLFFGYFWEVIDHKNNDIHILVGNQQLSSKDSKLINFMDLQAIQEHMKYEKSSILYDYVSMLLEQADVGEQEIFFNHLSQIVGQLFESNFQCLSYEISQNFARLIGGILDVSFTGNDILFNLRRLTEKYIALDSSKVYIVFYDSSLIPLDFLGTKFDNVYLFDVSQERKLEEYNISLLGEVSEFNYSILLDEIERLWPLPFERDRMIGVVSRYFHIFLSHMDYNTDITEEVVLNKVLNIIYKENRIIGYNPLLIDSNIKNFLTN